MINYIKGIMYLIKLENITVIRKIIPKLISFYINNKYAHWERLDTHP